MSQFRYRAAAFALAVGSLGLTIGLSRSAVKAQAPPAALVTDKAGYLAGETVSISGSGFNPNEVVSLQVAHLGGGAEQGAGHEVFPATADESGAVSATWVVGEDAAGHRFVLKASRAATDPVLPAVAPVPFRRIAVVQTDKYDYQPGEIALISGAGFRSGESVVLQVVHSNGRNDGVGHEPFGAVADDQGRIIAGWSVDPDDSEGSIFRLSARGTSSGITATATFTDLLVTVLDDDGPDDEPGQKDLNYLQIDYSPVTPDIAVVWGWDDTKWTGNNTGDACTLFDTDADGFANFSICITVDGAGIFDSIRLYTCTADNRTDRCGGPSEDVDGFLSTGSAAVQTADPFGVVGRANNPCDTTGCLTQDTVANLTVKLADVGATAAKLLNVCSYPSREPNSDPSDCVITPNSGFLTIVKTAMPNDGTAFTFTSTVASTSGVSSWPINGSGTVSLIPFASGTFNLTEAIPAGWKLSSASCVIQSNPTQNSGTGAAPPAVPGPANAGVNGVTIQQGLETICTFTNDKQAGSIKIVKTTLGGDGTFSFTPTGFGSGAFDLTTPNSSEMTFGTLAPGSNYSVSETTPTGWELTGQTCTNGTPAAITVVDGQTTTCTFTNRKKASLTLVKTVINDNGGTAQVSDFTLRADATVFTSGVAQLVVPTSYALSETNVTGYTASAWVCAGFTNGGSQSGSSVTLGAGESVTCTITNDDNAPSLTLVKTVINNNGGTAVATDFTLSAVGPTPISGAGGAISGGTFSAGAYALSETTVTGYAASAWACTGNGTQNGASIALALGQTATCTIINNDQPPSLTLVKTVVNDNGGTAVAANFTLSAAGPTPISGPGGATSGAAFAAGAYALSETNVTGYTASAWACTGNGTQNGASIALALGQTATCTIINDDRAPSLTLLKTVINDNGGTAVAANFTLSAAGPTPISGPGGATSGTAFAAGTYALSETNVNGYTPSAWVCTGTGTQNNGSITLALGQTATCTITNDDRAPSLTLLKNVINNWGGTAPATSWTLNAAGPTPLSGAGGVVSGAAFAAGTYNLSETGIVPGYTNGTTYACVVNGVGPTATNSVTLANADVAVCTISNSDIPANLTVTKVCAPAGDTGRFNLLIDGAGSTDTACGGSYNRLVSAGPHLVTESAGTGTALSDYVTVTGGACGPNGNIVLALGQSATCVITNTRKATIDVLKLTRGVAIENPLPGEPGYWSFTLVGPGVNVSHTTPPPLFDFDGIAGLNTPKLVPGVEYLLCETNLPAAWTVRLEVLVGNTWTIVPQVFNTNTSTVGPDGYSSVFDPNFVAFPGQYTNNTRCIKFVAEPGETVHFRLDNSFPGGEPRTIGFWKNWNTCTGGNQEQTAAKNGGPDAGFYILDDLLNNPGYTLGLLVLDGADCVQAIRILDKADIVSGQKKASDPAYNMAAQLFAAMLNQSAGAETCAAAVAAVHEGQEVLTLYGFNGTGNYAKKGALATRALAVTPILDQYNNGALCQ